MGEGHKHNDTRQTYEALGPLGLVGLHAVISGDLPGMKVLSGRTHLGSNQFPVEVSGVCSGGGFRRVFCLRPPGAPLVKALPVNPTDPAVTGPDIFAKLVPMAAHEASSLYRCVPELSSCLAPVQCLSWQLELPLLP